jgi:hypothetical protein
MIKKEFFKKLRKKRKGFPFLNKSVLFFLNLDDFFAFVESAIRTNSVRQLQFTALCAFRKGGSSKFPYI